jgi:hypothetical protein
MAHYNHCCVRPSHPLRSLLLIPVLALFCAFSALPLQAKDQSAAQTATLPAKLNHRLLLVLPFDNRTGQANLDWIGEAVSEIFNQRLDASGFDIISRDDRQYALEHLGLPRNFEPPPSVSPRPSMRTTSSSASTPCRPITCTSRPSYWT